LEAEIERIEAQGQTGEMVTDPTSAVTSVNVLEVRLKQYRASFLGRPG
jgi:hypothetical protein